jgi:hypothetical protein
MQCGQGSSWATHEGALRQALLLRHVPQDLNRQLA